MTTNSQTERSGTRQIFLYFTPLTLLVYLILPNGYLLDIATSYMLKNQLHATAIQVSYFRLLTAVPVYLSFVFGLSRDIWNPLGMRDRGFFLIFSLATAAIFLWMAFTNLTFAGLFTGMFLVMLTFRFVSAAYQGLIALVGQEKLMSGRLSALWNIVLSIPYVAGSFASGYVAEYLSPARTFVVVAIMSLMLAAMAFWKPRAVFKGAYDRPIAKVGSLREDVVRLVRHRAVYAPVLMMFMFQFSPGSNTPLQYYLTDRLHASDAVYGYFNAIFLAAFIPGFMLYGYLCRKVSLKKLLWWGLAITVPQMMPLALIHTANGALILAAPMGLMGAIAFCAIYDLAIRSCPAGLQGTLMMVVDAVNLLSTRGGDVLGAKMYSSSPVNGFLYCALATTAVYALMLPVILLVPKELMATADGEPNPAVS